MFIDHASTLAIDEAKKDQMARHLRDYSAIQFNQSRKKTFIYMYENIIVLLIFII